MPIKRLLGITVINCFCEFLLEFLIFCHSLDGGGGEVGVKCKGTWAYLLLRNTIKIAKGACLEIVFNSGDDMRMSLVTDIADWFLTEK